MAELGKVTPHLMTTLLGDEFSSPQFRLYIENCLDLAPKLSQVP